MNDPQSDQPQEARTLPKSAPGNNSASMAGGNESSPQAATQDHDAPPKKRAQLTRRGAGGPKTELGKRRASRNALKHAIFSDVIILREERLSKYRALLDRLVVDIQPEGAREEILVEQLATLWWRYRRLLRAERAEIDSASKAAQYSYMEGSFFEAARSARQDGMFGSAYPVRSWRMLEMAVELLKRMHQEIEEKGLDWNRDRGTLKLVYGTAPEYERRPRRSDGKMALTRVDPEPAGSLAKAYREAILPKGTRVRVGLDEEAEQDAEECLAFILKLIDDEIRMFQDLAEKWSVGEAHKMLRAMDASVVPPPEVAERLQRYEAMFERAIDRTLGQIDRLQRLRKGQPAPPEIRVNLST